MTIPVWVERQNGKFTASVPGVPALRAEAETKDGAVQALRGVLGDQSSGELLAVDIPSGGLSDLAGRYAEDDVSLRAWEELVAEAYRQRDEEKAREFPE